VVRRGAHSALPGQLLGARGTLKVISAGRGLSREPKNVRTLSVCVWSLEGSLTELLMAVFRAGLVDGINKVVGRILKRWE